MSHARRQQPALLSVVTSLGADTAHRQIQSDDRQARADEGVDGRQVLVHAHEHHAVEAVLCGGPFERAHVLGARIR